MRLCVCICVCTMCSNGFHKLEVKSPWELGCHDWSNQRLVCNFSCEVSPAIACPPKNISLIFIFFNKRQTWVSVHPFHFSLARLGDVFFSGEISLSFDKEFFGILFSSVNLINFDNYFVTFHKKFDTQKMEINK